MAGNDENNPSQGSLIGDTALIYARYGADAADGYSASNGGNPSRLGSGIATNQAKNAGFFPDLLGLKKR